MSSAEIKELRTNGHLEEALTLAIKVNDTYPDDPRTLNDILWCYDALCKREAEKGDANAFRKYFTELISTPGFSENKTINNTLCWRFRALLVKKSEGLSADNIPILADFVFEMVKKTNPEKSTEAYSVLCKVFYKLRDRWDGFIDFMDWWGWDSFRSEDYQCELYSDGRKAPISLVEGCYIGYSKILIKKQSVEGMQKHMPRLEKLNGEHPEMLYVGYYIGKQMLAMGQNDDTTLSVLCPFVRKKKTEFWAWQLLSEVFVSDEEKSKACLLRAANCHTKDTFLVNVYYSLANLFVKNAEYSNARLYISKYIEAKNKLKSRIPDVVLQWTRESWYQECSGCELLVQSIDYNAITDLLLYQDYPIHYVVVSFVNKDKKMANIIMGPKKQGFFKYDKYKKHLSVGEVLRMRWGEISSDGYIKPLTCELVKKEESLSAINSQMSEYCRLVTGYITENRTGSAKFLKFGTESAYIPREIWPQDSIGEISQYKSLVLLEYNKKKSEWGWRCIRIEPTK